MKSTQALRRWAEVPGAFRPGDVDLTQLRRRVGPRTDSPNVPHPDQGLGVSSGVRQGPGHGVPQRWMGG